MTFFVGDLVVSVSGCNIDENAGPLVDPCVELSVGNKLHSTRLPIGARNGPRAAGEGSKRRSPAVAFHGVTEGDVLTVTVLDRSPSSSASSSTSSSSSPSSSPGFVGGRRSSPSSPRPPFVAEAEPLRCTHWGAGGRAARRTCTVAPPEEVRRVSSWTKWAAGDSDGRTGGRESGGGGGYGGDGGGGGDGRGVSTIQLAICWSPAIRLRRPLSMVARAGRLTGKVVSRKIDRPVGAALNLVLDALETAAGLCSTALPLENSRWRAAALVASAVSLSLGSVLVAAAAAFFLPVALVVSAAAAAVFAALAPPTLAIGWILACTGPACEQLWRPLLVWMGTRWGFLRRSLLLPMDAYGYSESADGGGGEWGAGGDHGVLLRGQEASAMDARRAPEGGSLPSSPSAAVEGARQAEEQSNTMVTVDGGLGGTGDGATPVRGAADAGAVVLLLACYQNLIGVLHTGLEASRWRPRPR